MNCRRPGEWLNPRRRLYAEKLLHFLWWHGGKRSLNAETYDLVQYEQALDRWATDQAADDLYTLGAVDMRRVGEGWTLEALAKSVDEPAEVQPSSIVNPNRLVRRGM